MTSSSHHSKISTTFIFQVRIAPKKETRKIVYGILNEIEELDLDYTEHDYMRIKGHKRGHGVSRNLKAMVKLHMMLFDMITIVKRNFMSIGLVYFHFHSLLLIQDQVNNTEHYS